MTITTFTTSHFFIHTLFSKLLHISPCQRYPCSCQASFEIDQTWTWCGHWKRRTTFIGKRHPCTPSTPLTTHGRPSLWNSLDLYWKSQSYNTVLVIVGQLEPPCLELWSKGFAQVLWDHGWFRRIIHDWNMRFVSKYLTELCQLIGIEQNPSTTYHPQTDGRTERMNQMIEQYLWIFINYHQDNWKDW